MKIDYGTKKLKHQLTDASETKRAFGSMAFKVSVRMAEMSSATSLAGLMQIPAARCHALTGNRKGNWAVTISGNYRIIFEIDHHPPPLKNDMGIDVSSVTNIKITAIEDYH